MKINIPNLLTAIAIPLATGGLSAWLTRDGMNAFTSVQQPPLSPPMWIFPIVWILLYLLMGVASYLAAEAGASTNAFILYALQLFFNFFWSIWFFGLGWYLFAFLWLLVLWVLILATAVSFYRVSKPAGYLMLPYLLWVTFAAYLNLGVYLYQ